MAIPSGVGFNRLFSWAEEMACRPRPAGPFRPAPIPKNAHSRAFSEFLPLPECSCGLNLSHQSIKPSRAFRDPLPEICHLRRLDGAKRSAYIQSIVLNVCQKSSFLSTFLDSTVRPPQSSCCGGHFSMGFISFTDSWRQPAFPFSASSSQSKYGRKTILYHDFKRCI